MYPSDDDDDKSYVPDSEAYYSSSSDSVVYPENEELIKCNQSVYHDCCSVTKTIDSNCNFYPCF